MGKGEQGEPRRAQVVGTHPRRARTDARSTETSVHATRQIPISPVAEAHALRGAFEPFNPSIMKTQDLLVTLIVLAALFVAARDCAFEAVRPPVPFGQEPP